MFSKQPYGKTKPLLLRRPRRPSHGLPVGWKILLPLFFCGLLTGVVALFSLTGPIEMLRSGQKPDLPQLQKRFELLMTWTLPEVHWDDMHLSGLRKQDDEWIATYRFVVYATEGSAASPAISARLKRRFPECGELLFQPGKACTVEERVRFVTAPPHGLVPETIILDYPELLSQME